MLNPPGVCAATASPALPASRTPQALSRKTPKRVFTIAYKYDQRSRPQPVVKEQK